MGSKRLNQHRALRQLLTIAGIMMLMACSWVKDDTDDCPSGFWLRLHYAYNILDVEAVQKYVNDAYVYVYDADGNFVKRIFATQQDLLANNHKVKVEGLTEGDYRFVVWSGLGNSEYAVSGDTQAQDDFRLSLVRTGMSYSGSLPPLYYGALPVVHYSSAYAVHDVQMMKDTNQMACLIVPVAEGSEMDAGDYTMRVVAANSVIDAYNQPVAVEPTSYEPYVQENVTIDDDDYGELNGVKYSLTTLRMMSDRDCRLILEKNSTGEQVFNISFPEYIGMIGSLYTNLGRPLSVQEYLDRQDFYTIVFYLSADLDQLLQLQVNSWRIRASYHLKL